MANPSKKKKISEPVNERAYIFPALFVSPSNRQGALRLTFDVDEASREASDHIGDNPMGTNFIILAYRLADSTALAETIKEAPDKGKALFDFSRKSLMRKIHAIIADYSEMTGVDEEHVKDALRARLKTEKKIKKSLSELNDMGLASAVFTLQTDMHPLRFDYTVAD